MNFKRSFTPLAMVLACAAPLAAQETVGTLVGSVTNSATGKAIAGVKLVLRSPKMLGDRVATTDADGGFRIPLLPNGDYTLSSTAEGFNSSTVRFAVLPGQTTRQNMRLAAIQTAYVEVLADSAAQIDKTETQVQTIFAMDDIKAITGGDLLRIVDVAPNVITGGGATGGTVMSVRGGNNTGGRFLVNGLDAADPGWGNFDPSKMMVTEMVETVAIISSPLNARYGNTESGMMSFVTTRGSNEFKGSIRTQYGVNGTYGTTWQPSRDHGRNGTGTVSTDRRGQLSDGVAYRNWEATVSGPLWKDHITFAWGGRFYPATTSTLTVDRSQWNPLNPKWDTVQGGVLMPVGALGSGMEVRKGNMFDVGKTYDNPDVKTFNQYSLFWQINANHSLDWSYSEYSDAYKSLYANSIDLHSGNYSAATDTNRIWNLAYKGLVGPGVLEARYGRSSYSTNRPDTSADSYAEVRASSLYTNYNTGFSISDSGKPGQSLQNYGGNPSDYPYTNMFEAGTMGGYQYTYLVNGSPYDKTESKQTDSLLANYEVALGNHLIDGGINYVKTHWDTVMPQSGMTIGGTGGQIDPNLTDADILYPAGYTGAAISAADYAGKWIVWDATVATLDLQPNRPNYNSGQALATDAMGAPSMTKYYGNDAGGFDETTTSLYANDIWQYSNKFTFMGGLRYDKFKVKDTVSTVLSYGILSPRFEVKYDINGDQKRVLSYSWAKFHNRMPSAAFMALVHRRRPYSVTLQWNAGLMGVDATGTKALKGGLALVDTATLKDASNYTYYRDQNNPMVYSLDSGFKADYNIEQTVSFARAYDNGSNWRATAVYRQWKNNYQWFVDDHSQLFVNPYAPVSTTPVADDKNPNYVPKRILANDSGLYHTYHSFELEWNLVLAKRATLSGNYSYSRNYSNQMYYAAQTNYSYDNVGVSHAPWGINHKASWAMLGEGLNDITQPDVVRNQIANAWITFDLGTGALKQSLVFRAKWILGSTYTVYDGSDRYLFEATSAGWGYVKSEHNAPANYPSAAVLKAMWPYIYKVYPNTNFGDNKNPDDLTYSLKYNLDVPISNQIHWWAGIEVVNVFNQAYRRNQLNYMAAGSGSDLTKRGDGWYVDGSKPGTPNANGFRIPGSNMQAVAGDYIDGGRYINFETGIRF